MSSLTGFAIISGLVALAYWRRLPMLYGLAGMGLIIYGFTYWDASTVLSIILVVTGIATLTMMFWDKGAKER